MKVAIFRVKGKNVLEKRLKPATKDSTDAVEIKKKKKINFYKFSWHIIFVLKFKY